jgi:hypothetical protein
MNIQVAVSELQDEISKNIGVDEAKTFGVLMDAYLIYLDRGKKYGQLWRSYGWKGNVFHILSKAARIRRMFWDSDMEPELAHDMDGVMDDVLDIINYAAFVIMDMRDGNKYGR